MDVILTTYFHSKVDPQRNEYIEENSFAYMKDWYRSVQRLGLNAVILHDGLSDDFIARNQTKYIRFFNTKSQRPVSDWNMLDERWFAYLAFLLQHPCNNVFCTDISDVVVVQDPFISLKASGWGYVIGEDAFPVGHVMPFWQREALNGGCPIDVVALCQAPPLEKLLNCGVMGGRYETVVDLFGRFTQLRTKVGLPTSDFDMFLFNTILYQNPLKNFHHGDPVTSKFYGHENDRKDVWFIHK